MNRPPAVQLPGNAFIAILLLSVLVLFLVAWGTLALEARGYARDYAHNLLRLALLPALAGGCRLMVRDRKRFLRRLWSLRPLSVPVALSALAIGLLARLLAWSVNFAEIAFGWNPADSTGIAQPFAAAFACPPAAVMLAAILTWCLVIPLVEEFINRGLLMSSLVRRGPVIAVGVSAFLFACGHAPQNFLLALAFGVVFGIQYWRTRTIWAPVITHAAYDGLIPLDSLCLVLNWQPGRDELPVITAGLIAVAAGLASAVAITWLLLTTRPDSRAARPGTSAAGARS